MPSRLIPLIALLLVSPAIHAQLVRLTFHGTATSGDPGENWFDPGELVFGETPVTVDLTYNLALPGDEPDGGVRYYHPENDPFGRPEDYSFRVRMGNVDLTRQLSNFTLVDNGVFAVEAFGEGHELSLAARFAPPGVGLPLPSQTPPFAEFDPTGTAILLTSNLPHDPPLDAGILFVGMNAVEFTHVTPIPEPATYAIGATVLLAALVVARRRRQPLAVSDES